MVLYFTIITFYYQLVTIVLLLSICLIVFITAGIADVVRIPEVT
jgi:hypothetical protein